MRSITDFFQPLQRKLPLLLSGLLCVIVLAFGWLAQRELGRAFDATAEARLLGAAERLATLLIESTTRFGSELQGIASDSAVVRLFTAPGSASRQAAEARLRRQRVATTQAPSRAILGRDCSELLAVGSLAAPVTAPDCAAPPRRATGSAASASGTWVLPFVARGDTVLYGIMAPIIGPSADTLGFLVHTRSLAGGQGAREISSLIGDGAAFLVGNASGDVLWTDQSRPVAGPPRPATSGTLTEYTPADGSRQLGVALEVASTPWLVWVQMPASTMLAPKARTLRNLATIALLCIVLGALGAWMVSNRVTAPLIEVTRAADDLAQGNYARRVTTTRRDELGHLMTSFNRMATQVEQASEELKVQAEALEDQVMEAQELTRELELSNAELVEAARDAKAARTDSALAESLLTEVLSRAPVGIAVFDQELRYVRLNAALAEINSVPLNAHIGRRPREIAPVLGELAEGVLARVLETGETVANQRLSGTLAGGTKHWLASYFPIPGPDGERVGVGAIVLDTTAQYELEAQFLQAQKMEAVGRLAGGVAHDFNNLLTVISSYADLLVEDLDPTDARREDLNEIRGASDRASALTRQLLAFSRKQVLQPKTLSLNAVVDGVEKMLGRLIGADVDLTTVCAPDLGMVNADPGQLEQVIVNLVVNARDAMPGGGRITIETANVELSGTDAGRRISVPPGSYVMLAVSDTGHGMDPDVLEHLFEPFFTTKPQGQGTGLGLSTVFGIVRQSGGDVWVYSEVGHGTTFKVYLPRTNPVAAPGAVATGAAVPQRGAETILLAEDDDALRALARRVLVKQGYTVLEARNGREALVLCTNYEGAIHLVLSDIVMPELGGRALVERLAASRPRTRVLFMSGYTDDDVIRRALIDHRTEFLQKPFTPQSLSQRVRQVLDSRDHA
jgi:signal transduction histidine kinase/ActR/RegA family two-component response regulator